MVMLLAGFGMKLLNRGLLVMALEEDTLGDEGVVGCDGDELLERGLLTVGGLRMMGLLGVGTAELTEVQEVAIKLSPLVT